MKKISNAFFLILILACNNEDAEVMEGDFFDAQAGKVWMFDQYSIEDPEYNYFKFLNYSGQLTNESFIRLYQYSVPRNLNTCSERQIDTEETTPTFNPANGLCRRTVEEIILNTSKQLKIRKTHIYSFIDIEETCYDGSVEEYMISEYEETTYTVTDNTLLIQQIFPTYLGEIEPSTSSFYLLSVDSFPSCF